MALKAGSSLVLPRYGAAGWGARKLLPVGLAAVGLLAGAMHARANLVIIPTFDSTITSDPNAAAIEGTINQAIQFYETNITTPITVAITYQGTNSGLGQNLTNFSTITYSQYLAALQAHSSGDANDVSALATLPAGPINPVNGNTNMDLTTANLRALGFTANPPGGTDSTVSLNTSIMNITRTSIDPSKYDLLSVVENETNKALGLGSNLDFGSTTGDISDEDLFRYAGAGVRSYTLSPVAVSYFSIDGGATNIIGFNQSGEGSEYGSWANSATPHVQDAFGTPGATPNMGPLETTALDVIGYNFVPEPVSLGLLAMGGLVLLRRHR